MRIVLLASGDIAPLVYAYTTFIMRFATLSNNNFAFAYSGKVLFTISLYISLVMRYKASFFNKYVTLFSCFLNLCLVCIIELNCAARAESVNTLLLITESRNCV